MLIESKCIDCATKSVFNTWKLPTGPTDLSGDIYWAAIVWIKDTGEIWTHGKLYGGGYSNADSNKVSLSAGGTSYNLSRDGHVQSYTTLTGSGTTANQAILSSGTANGWTLKTLGKNAFSNDTYLLATATAEAAKKVVNALTIKANNANPITFDGSSAKTINLIPGANITIEGSSDGNISISSNPSDTTNTAGAENLVGIKMYLIGAQTQTAAPKTFSNVNVYIGTDNCLYSNGAKVLTTHQTIYNLDIQTLVGTTTTKVVTFDPNAAANSFTLAQGTNVTLTPDATNKKVTIASADTKNTAGTTNKAATKLFLVGAASQAANPQTFSNSLVYIGTDNKLYSNNVAVSVEGHTHNYLPIDGTAVKATNIAGGVKGSIPYQSAKDTTALLAPPSTTGWVLKYNLSTNTPYWAEDLNTTYSTKDFKVNNSTYKLYTSSASLPTVWAPTTIGTPGQIMKVNGDGDGFVWAEEDTGSDTRNTTGATNLVATKLFLVGSKDQTANPVTYSNVNVYIGTNNQLYSNGSLVLTVGNYASTLDTRYIKKTGDSVSGTLDWTNAATGLYALKLGTSRYIGIDGSDGSSMLHWTGGGTVLGSIKGTTSIRSNTSDLKHNYNGTEYTILDTRNYTSSLDGRYVKKAGDTMTGTLVMGGSRPITLSGGGNISISEPTNSGWANSVQYKSGDTSLVGFGAYGTNATLNYAYIGSGYESANSWLKISPTLFTYNNNNIVHAGNYTSIVVKLGTTTIGGTAKGIYLNGGTPTAMSATVGSTSLPVYMNAGTITACSTTLGVSITGTAPRLIPSELTNQDLNTYTYSSYSGRMYYAGGSNTTTNVPTGVGAYGLMIWRNASGYTGQLMYSSSGDWYSRYYNGTTWTAWDKLAHITDNVASATKLQTARTINGTSFNGTANITTATWGTARNIGIVSSDGSGASVVTSVNGSANVNLKLPATITATLNGAAARLSMGSNNSANAASSVGLSAFSTSSDSTTNFPSNYGHGIRLQRQAPSVVTSSQAILDIFSGTGSKDIYIRSSYGNGSSMIWGTWGKILTSANFSEIVDDVFVKKSGDTMTGILKIQDGGSSPANGLQTVSSNGLIMYAGTTSTYLSQQAGTTYIRSGATNLIHRKNGTDYILLDASNHGTYTNKVYQSETTTGNYRALAMGYTDSTTPANLVTATTQQVYVSSKIYAQPSTGTIFATTFNGKATNSASADKATYLLGQYNSGGLEKPNWGNFGSAKLKLQMLHAGANNMKISGQSWADVLYMSSYAGGDVKTSHALVFPKSTGPREMYIFAQAYDAAEWDTAPARVISSANYTSILDSRYVNVSGDTMTGKLTISHAAAESMIINSTGTETYIRVQNAGASKSCFGWHNNVSFGTYMYSSASSKYLGIKDDGTPHFQGNTLWHAGNDGSGSGLDADKLRGLAPSTSATANTIAQRTSNGYLYATYVNVNNPTEESSTFSRVFFETNSDGFIRKCSVSRFRAQVTDNYYARRDQNPAADLNTVNGFGIMSNPANANATADRHYPIVEAGTMFYGTAAYGSANQLYGTYNTNRWFVRGGGGSATAKTSWVELVKNSGTWSISISGTATKATHLAGGAQGSIPYQSAAGTTAYLAASATNGYVLKFNTSTKAPYWAADINTDTDTKVTQSATTVSTFRPIVFGYTNTSTVGDLAATVTQQVYVSTKFYAQPSTGNLYATTFVGALSGNASTATALQTSRSIFGKSFNGTANVAGQAYVYGNYTATASSRYSNGGLQIRENGLVGSAQTDDGYAPAIGFHWGSRGAASLIYTTSGFKFMNQAFTGYHTVYANFNGSLTGNASSATKLATARTINGTSFDGTANITTVHWGTARTITIGSSGKSVNGGANVSFSRDEMNVAYGDEKSYSGTTTASSWYRIATSSSGINNCSGIFTITAVASGYHTNVILSAGTSYGNANGTSIVQLSCSNYGNSQITAARIVYHTSYTNNYAYLEIQANTAISTTFYVKLLGGAGWSLTGSLTAGSIPSGYSSKSLTLGNDSVRATTFVGNLTGTASVASKLGTVTVGSSTKPIYLNAGTATASTSTVGAANRGVYLSGGSITAMSSTVGSTTLPVYMNGGTITACGTSLAVSVTGTAAKLALNPSGLSTATYGSYGGIVQDSTSGPTNGTWYNKIKILHNNATGYYTELAQAFTGTAGLWHRRNVTGTVSAWAAVVDSVNYTTYIKKIGTTTVGSASRGIYLSGGTPTAMTSTVGSTTLPVYMTNGTITVCSTTLGVSITGNAATATTSTKLGIGAGIGGSQSTSYHVFIPFFKDGTIDGSCVKGTFTTLRSTSVTGTGAAATGVYEVFVKNSRWSTTAANNSRYGYVVNKLCYDTTTEEKVGFCTATYNGEVWFGLRIYSFQDYQIRFDGYTTNTLTPIAYYKTYNGEQVLNSEINGSIKTVSVLTLGSFYYNGVRMALVTDNVASATQLATSRTLWGQSFNGSKNVSGSLSGVGNITASGAISIISAGGNSISLKYNGADATSVILNSTQFKPFDAANGKLALGSTSARWNGVYSITGSFTGDVSVNSRLTIDSTGKVLPYSTATRRSGVYGIYDANKIGHIWSMGAAYQIPDDGSNFGNLYGFAYKHTNNTTGGTMASGHQAVWCENGTARVAMGTNFWVANSAIVGGALSAKTISVTSTEAVKHLAFSRGNFNYITAPASGSVVFVVNGQNIEEATSDLVISNGQVRPGANNATSLGLATRRWSNVYSQLLNVSGSASTGALSVNGTIVATDHIVSRGTKFTLGPVAGGEDVVIQNYSSDNKHWSGLNFFYTPGENTFAGVMRTDIQCNLTSNGAIQIHPYNNNGGGAVAYFGKDEAIFNNKVTFGGTINAKAVTLSSATVSSGNAVGNIGNAGVLISSEYLKTAVRHGYTSTSVTFTANGTSFTGKLRRMTIAKDVTDSTSSSIGVVSIILQIPPTSYAEDNKFITCSGTIPVGFRPYSDIICVAGKLSSNGPSGRVLMRIQGNGTVSLYGSGTDTLSPHFVNACYLVENT